MIWKLIKNKPKSECYYIGCKSMKLLTRIRDSDPGWFCDDASLGIHSEFVAGIVRVRREHSAQRENHANQPGNNYGQNHLKRGTDFSKILRQCTILDLAQFSKNTVCIIQYIFKGQHPADIFQISWISQNGKLTFENFKIEKKFFWKKLSYNLYKNEMKLEFWSFRNCLDLKRLI